MDNIKRLSDLDVGDIGILVSLPERQSVKNKLMNLGFTKGTRIECIGKSPLGDPSAFLIRGGVVALRREDCFEIFID